MIPLVVEFIEGHIKSTLSRAYTDNNKRISNASSENVSLLSDNARACNKDELVNADDFLTTPFYSMTP